jgi:type IV fimbrial biogenesis protein FimT
MTNKASRHDGFTLVELMVTLAVIAILAMFAVPNFGSLMRRHRVTSVANQLLADLSYARTEAAMRGKYVSICASDDGTSCSSSPSYASGWIVYAYPTGAAGANQAYDSTKKDTYAMLRTTSARQGVAITATDATRLTYGQQGQVKRDLEKSPFGLIVCSRPSNLGAAENSATVPAIKVGLIGSGGVVLQTLAPSASCS